MWFSMKGKRRRFVAKGQPVAFPEREKAGQPFQGVVRPG